MMDMKPHPSPSLKGRKASPRPSPKGKGVTKSVPLGKDLGKAFLLSRLHSFTAVHPEGMPLAPFGNVKVDFLWIVPAEATPLSQLSKA